MSEFTHVRREGEEALEQVREMLNAMPQEAEDVVSVEVRIEHASSGEPDKPSQDVDQGPDVEVGPVDEPSREGGHGGGGGEYKGSLPPHLFEGEAIRPDSFQGRVLDVLDSQPNKWWGLDELDEELEEMEREQVSDALSVLFVDQGYVRRRKMDPQPPRKGVHREYQVDEPGRSALAEGKRTAEYYYEEQREEMNE